MLQIAWFYCVYTVAVPMVLFFTMPFHKIRWYEYAKYIVFDVLKIKLYKTNDIALIDTGYILANHRSWFDFALDPLLADSAIVGRRLAYIPVIWGALLGITERRFFWFIRGKENRTELFLRIKNHLSIRKRILFFPEGTRMKYTQLSSPDEVKTYLKYGILKEIYRDKMYPIQIQISSNKELVFNEKKLHIKHGIEVRTHRTKAIYPMDYESEQEFYNEIAKEWYNAWVATHA